MNELEESSAKQDLDAAMNREARYKLLEVAVVVLKVLAVAYFLLNFYSLFFGPASEGSRMSMSEKIGPLATLIALAKEVLIAFFVFISGELIRLQLDTRRIVGGS